MSLTSGEMQSVILRVMGILKVPMLIASKTSVAGGTQTATNLDFQNGAALNTHIPLFAIIKYRSGTLGIAVIALRANSAAISAGIPLLTLDSGNNMKLDVTSGLKVANSGNLSANVTTGSLAASAFDIYVYGVPL